MCSIFKYKTVVGRNFDYDESYDEKLIFIDKYEYDIKYSIHGMSTGYCKDYPLLYDGINDNGLVVGGLAFTGNAVYTTSKDKKYNIPSYDFTYWILRNYGSVREVKDVLGNVSITDEEYSSDYPVTDLHWFIADKDESIIVEQTSDGLDWYESDVMTNNPPYPRQIGEYKLFKPSIGRLFVDFRNDKYTRGLNTVNLAGDYTSMGRFERLSWLKEQLLESDTPFSDEDEAFHLLSSVEQVYGATPVDDRFEYTIYSIVYDMENISVTVKSYDGESEYAI